MAVMMMCVRLPTPMNIRYQHAEGGVINHSNAIMVLDEHGKMIEQTNGTSTAGEDAVVAALNNKRRQYQTINPMNTITSVTAGYFF